jgi:hypothetical protein
MRRVSNHTSSHQLWIVTSRTNAGLMFSNAAKSFAPHTACKQTMSPSFTFNQST